MYIEFHKISDIEMAQAVEILPQWWQKNVSTYIIIIMQEHIYMSWKLFNVFIGIFQESKVKGMFADALALCVTRSSSAIDSIVCVG